MRLKDADTLKKALERAQYTKEFCAEHHIDYSISMQMVGMIIDNAPTIIIPTSELDTINDCGWICCEDHLPEKDDDYLVTYLMRDIPVVGKSWFNTKCGFIYDNVIAWQPLPKPYKEGD